MIGSREISIRIGSCAALCAGLLAAFTPQHAFAADCPGHPDALGTSRTLVVDPRAHPRIGTMQYPETLPLADHEVVLTFDDGPVPKNSNQILKILADQCIKATFFTIGAQARANPEGVRKLEAAGHTVANHSQNHPLTFEKMPIEKARPEIEDGIASVTAAASNPADVAPFFRIPGLLRAEAVENYLGSRGIQVWSADFLADDWRHISSDRVYQLAIQRLEQKGKGILLLHDIQARTVAALPRILNEMKARGYRIVHVVPATPDRPATPTDPSQWQLHPPSESVPIARWPKVPNFALAEAAMLPAPVLSDFDAPAGSLLLSEGTFDRVRLPRKRETSWPVETGLIPKTMAMLPVPAESLFQIPPDARAAFEPPRRHVVVDVESERRSQRAADREHHAGKRSGRSRTDARVAHTASGTAKPESGKPARRGVRVASLKKRKT
jgi:peptidoglycan-N-acetylglucosamine deacetylase